MHLPRPISEQLSPLFQGIAQRTSGHLDRDPGQAVQRVVIRQAFAYLRRHYPILVLPRFAVVTRYDDVKDVLARDEDFGVTEVYAERMERTSGPFILGMERTARYEREAAWLRGAVHDDDVARVRHLTRGYVADALEAARRASRGDVVELDLVARLTRRIPVLLIRDYFGVPVADEAQMMRWMRATFWELFLNLTNDRGVRRAAEEAAAELNPYLEQVIAARAQELADGDDRDDFLSRLIRTRASFGETPFSDFDVRRNLAGVIIGAVDTLNKAGAQLVAELLRRPEQLAAAQRAARADDLDLVSRYAFEALRYDPLNPILLRVCRRDTFLAPGTPREASIAAGTTVCVATQSAMFDPERFERPEEFRVDRPYESYLLFGDGQHRCFGEAFNRVILPELLLALLRLPQLRRPRGRRGMMTFEGPFPDRFLLEFEHALS
ncbi:MAG: cytochrome P450 [Myxococcales bacterium]|nr:cytochrome P450 [Myxococcales bacterium]